MEMHRVDIHQADGPTDKDSSRLTRDEHSLLSPLREPCVNSLHLLTAHGALHTASLLTEPRAACGSPGKRSGVSDCKLQQLLGTYTGHCLVRVGDIKALMAP